MQNKWGLMALSVLLVAACSTGNQAGSVSDTAKKVGDALQAGASTTPGALSSALPGVGTAVTGTATGASSGNSVPNLSSKKILYTVREIVNGGKGKATDSKVQFFLMNAEGSEKTKIAELKGINPNILWSPDGNKILVALDQGKVNMWVMNTDGSGLKNLTENASANVLYPAWSPDSSQIAYLGNGVRVMNADGSNDRQVTPAFLYPMLQWSPDGTMLAVAESYHLKIVKLDGSLVTALTNGKGSTDFPQSQLPNPSAHFHTSLWSKDMKTLVFVYQSDKQTKSQIHTSNLDGSDKKAVTVDSQPVAYISEMSKDKTKMLVAVYTKFGVARYLTTDKFEVIHKFTIDKPFSLMPDGNKIYYNEQGSLFITDLNGSNAQKITLDPGTAHIIWRE